MRSPVWTTTAMTGEDAPGERARAPVPALALAVLAALLPACATYAPAPIDPAESAHSFAARRLDAPELRDEVARFWPASSPWPPATWDRAQLLAIALVQNPELAVARAEVAASVAHETGAGQLPNPTFGLQSEYARREPQHWLYGVSIDVPLPVIGLRQLEVELARQESAASRSRLMERTWSVRRALIGALSDAQSARRRLDVLTRLAAAQERLVDVQHLRVAAGEDTPADLAVAQAAAIDIEEQLAQARADDATAHAAIASALGLPPDAIDGIGIAWNDWGNPPADAKSSDAREQALLSRADLAAAIDEYAQNETKLKQAIARQYPQLEFKPGYYWDHGIAKWPLDVGVTLPLFNRNQGEIAEATAARDVAGWRLLATQASIFGEIEAAERSERIARDNVDVAMRRVEVARRQVEHADLALRAGALDRMERSNVEIVALRADLENVQAQAQLQSARNALEDALHAPLSGPELALAASKPSAESGADR